MATARPRLVLVSSGSVGLSRCRPTASRVSRQIRRVPGARSRLRNASVAVVHAVPTPSWGPDFNARFVAMRVASAGRRSKRAPEAQGHGGRSVSGRAPILQTLRSR
jgi:hypothetical protein